MNPSRTAWDNDPKRHAPGARARLFGLRTQRDSCADPPQRANLDLIGVPQRFKTSFRGTGAAAMRPDAPATGRSPTFPARPMSPQTCPGRMKSRSPM